MLPSGMAAATSRFHSASGRPSRRSSRPAGVIGVTSHLQQSAHSHRRVSQACQGPCRLKACARQAHTRQQPLEALLSALCIGPARHSVSSLAHQKACVKAAHRGELGAWKQLTLKMKRCPAVSNRGASSGAAPTARDTVKLNGFALMLRLYKACPLESGSPAGRLISIPPGDRVRPCCLSTMVSGLAPPSSSKAPGNSGRRAPGGGHVCQLWTSILPVCMDEIPSRPG